jgi:hypothetical protein
MTAPGYCSGERHGQQGHCDMPLFRCQVCNNVGCKNQEGQCTNAYYAAGNFRCKRCGSTKSPIRIGASM